MQVRLLPDALVSFAPSILTARTIWLVRLSAQDGGPSSRKGGFDSRTGHLTRNKKTRSGLKFRSTRQLTLAARRELRELAITLAKW
jgi:hypothetical protein